MFIHVKGKLMDLSSPKVMGILNATPDSFYAGSRKQTEAEILDRVRQLREEEADIIDVGAYSSRPGATFVSEEEEISRLDKTLTLLFKEYPESIVSIDTFRSTVARHCVEKYGVAIINDISGGEMDDRMFATVADLQIPYILMHMRGTPETMMKDTCYENFQQEIFTYFSRKTEALRLLGVNDIILDPGFGFSKTLEHNYFLLQVLGDFRIFDLPLLVGVSRKKMIRDVLDCPLEESLNGTTILNVYALMSGARIIRVHDVKAAVQAVRLLEKIKHTSL